MSLISRHADRARLHIVFLLAPLFVLGCGSGLPSIPDAPDQILAKGDAYFEKEKYLQAQALYQGFLKKHAGHDRGDYAQFMLGESYFSDGEYALAAVEYRILVTNYGYSDYVDDALLKEALCLFKQSPDSAKDQQKTYEALDKLNQFIKVFPNSPLIDDALEQIQQINRKLAHKELDNAKFYVRTKQYISAIIYLDKIIENYGTNEYWAEALYLKAEVLYQRGEDFDEAIRLLSQLMAYPEEIGIKGRAKRLLRQIRNETSDDG